LLNGGSYESKVISVDAHNGRLWWRLWADRYGGWTTPSSLRQRLRDGSAPIDPRTILLGRRRCDYTNVGDPVPQTLWMGPDDRYELRLQLQRVTYGRRRGRKRLSWSVDWTSESGIPTKPGGRGRIYGSAVEVSDFSVAAGIWPVLARARIRSMIDEERVRNAWDAETVTA
jgi:hypothetical protein